MSIKRYTYADPRSLGHADFWPEIQDLPHLCISRVLVRGLIHIMRDQIGALICPLDEVIDDPGIYGSWTQDVQRQIKQNNYLTSQFLEMRQKGEITEKHLSALKHQKGDFLKALRLFLELGITAQDIDDEAATPEERFFIYLLHKVRTEYLPQFRFPKAPSRSRLEEVFQAHGQKELDEYTGMGGSDQSRIVWHKRVIRTTSKNAWNAVVIHGVHQFSAPQLRFVQSLERAGVDVIFLHNAQDNYGPIYATWDRVYQPFAAPLRRDRNVPGHTPSHGNGENATHTQGHSLACALGALYSGNHSGDDFSKWYSRYNDLSVIEFDNVSEYADFVSRHFQNAIQRAREEIPIPDRPHVNIARNRVLFHMEEQVYTANREIHQLLAVYYPEYSPDRHFLAYPIGQFFTALYRLWDWEQGFLRFDGTDIKACLSPGMLRTGRSAEQVLKCFSNLEIVFQGIDSCQAFRQRMDNYLEAYRKVNRAHRGAPGYPFRKLSIYNSSVVSEDDILELMRALEELEKVAKHLFANNLSRSGGVDFRQHFERLEEYIRGRQPSLVNKEEQDLINSLLGRFEGIRDGAGETVGTFEDLRDGLHFYLKQREREHVDWIVKNFEQIEGDILLNMGQHKTYHFACLSDRDLGMPLDQLLPWPLSDSFIHRCCSPSETLFQVYCNALSERNNFMRYCLFYGLYYTQCPVRLSYVRSYGDETTELYSPLHILGLAVQEEAEEDQLEHNIHSLLVGKKKTASPVYQRYEMMDMFLCPYRYLVNYVLNDQPVLNSDYLFNRYVGNVLLQAVWRKLKGHKLPLDNRMIATCFHSSCSELKTYFPFWSESVFLDMERRAANYFQHKVLTYRSNIRNGQLGEVSNEMLETRGLFGVATLYENIEEHEPLSPYEVFEALTKTDQTRKEYPLLQVPSPKWKDKEEQRERMRQAVEDYLNNVAENQEIPGVWCDYCTARGMCVKPFLMEL